VLYEHEFDELQHIHLNILKYLNKLT